jgi:hypothetical protein
MAISPEPRSRRYIPCLLIAPFVQSVRRWGYVGVTSTRRKRRRSGRVVSWGDHAIRCTTSYRRRNTRTEALRRLFLRTSCLHTEDTLDCLRHTPYETLRTAIEASMGNFNYTVWALATQNVAHLDLPFIVVHGAFVDTSTRRCLHKKFTGGYDPRLAGSRGSCHQWCVILIPRFRCAPV